MKLFLLLLLVTMNVAQAAHQLNKFRPDYWTKGFHLNAGGGLNAAYFDSDKRFTGTGLGLNLKTDLGYYFTNRFAVEWSTNVKFNSLNNYLIWDTLITGGIRYRIKDYYVRGFYGKAPTVIFFNGHAPPEYKHTTATRLQFDGPAFGMAVGKYFRHKKDLVWFLEGAGTFQRLNEREAVHVEKEVPEVVAREKDRSTIMSVYVNIGILIF